MQATTTVTFARFLRAMLMLILLAFSFGVAWGAFQLGAQIVRRLAE